MLPNNQLIVEGEWVSGVRLADERSGAYLGVYVNKIELCVKKMSKH